jgi:signal transduction histidine kinase
MFNKLHLRIWFAVVLSIVVLTVLVGWVWSNISEPPMHQLLVHNQAGEPIGKGHLVLRPKGQSPGFIVNMHDGTVLHMDLQKTKKGALLSPLNFLWVLALVAAVVALSTYPIVRRLTRRLETLQHSVEQWGDGNLNARVTVEGGDEVGLLAMRFNHSADQVQALITARDTLLASQKSLLANASHELRSPLTRIRMGLELMTLGKTGPAQSEIARNIQELDQLIDEILLASRLDADETNLGTIETIDLVGLAAEECARMQAELILETTELPLEVQGVAKLLLRSLRNLLENAHRHATGEVRLRLSRAPGRALVTVRDQGPGIPEAEQLRIFEPFYRLPGASERDGGVGLGLALVKSIALRHGGSVRCYNAPDGGACFEISLPASPK